jgi:hypothetical protein
MKINISYYAGEFCRDPEQTPAWSEQIGRWSQLDDASYIVAEAAFKNELDLKNISQVFLVTTQGSSLTDANFVKQNKVSAQTFVHTLPNVRALSFSLVTGWQGPIWCLSKGQHSFVNLLQQISFVSDQSLIINLNRSGAVYHCDFIHVAGKSGTHQLIKNSNESYTDFLLDDFTLRDYLQSRAEIQITPSLELRKNL